MTKNTLKSSQESQGSTTDNISTSQQMTPAPLVELEA